jgi:valyl-tRNA synthetase
VLDTVMRLLHPFMPFISEEIWSHMPHRESALVVAAWPERAPALHFPEAAREMELAQAVIHAMRNLRSQVNLPPGKEAPVIVRAPERIAAWLEEERHQIARLCFAAPLTIDSAASKPRQALAAVVGEGVEIYLPLAGVIDLEAETARLQKELDALEKELRRTEGKLNNPGFLAKAPPEVVSKEEERREEYLARWGKLQERLRELS